MALLALKGYTWPAYFVNWTIYWFKLFIIWCSSHASQISLHPSSFPPSWSHQLRPLIGQNGGSGRVKNQTIWVELHKIDNQNQWMVQVTKYADWVYYLSAGASSTQFQLPAALNKDGKQWPNQVHLKLHLYTKNKMENPSNGPAVKLPTLL